MGHFGESHLAPFRNSLVFSRRQRLQSAPVYRAMAGFLPLHPAPLGRSSAIERNRDDVLDRADLQTGRLQRPDGGLPARARTLHEHVDLAHSVLHGPAGGGLSGHLRGERRGLARALESHLPGRRPGNDAAAGVGDRDYGVVERALDMSVPVSDVLPLFPAYLLDGSGATLGRHPLPQVWRWSDRCLRRVSMGRRGAADYFFPAFFLPATVFFLPFLVRALVCVRCPCTGSPRRCRMPW